MTMIITVISIIWLLGLSVFDIRSKRVPVWLLAAGGIAALGFWVFEWIERGSLGEYLWGPLPGGVLLLIAAATKKVGWADGIILMALGAAVGLGSCIMIVMVSFFLLSTLSAGLLGFGKANRNTRLPYAPFLAAADLIWVIVKG